MASINWRQNPYFIFDLHQKFIKISITLILAEFLLIVYNISIYNFLK